MRKHILISLMFLMVFSFTAYAVGTVSGTDIIAVKEDNTLSYQDGTGTQQTTEEAASNITVIVDPEWGFDSFLGNAVDQITTAGNAVYFAYGIQNDGNAYDDYGVKFDVNVENGNANWVYQVVDSSHAALAATDGVPGNTGSVANDDTYLLTLIVTPSASALDSPNGSYSDVTVSVTTDATPVGEYTGANTNSYGGVDSATDQRRTTIAAGVMTLTRVVTVDAPSAYTGGIHDAVPGSVITYSFTASNEGSDDATNVVIIDKVPLEARAAHFGATGEALSNVTITAAAPSGTIADWSRYTSVNANPGMDYDGSNWLSVGAVGTVLDVTSSSGLTYVKWQKATIPAGEFVTVTWGVTID